MEHFRVIIIGAGLAGSLMANGLMRNDIDVQVYEREERHSKREGFQIRLTTPAIVGMRACLSPEHLRSVVEKFGPASGMESEAPRVVHKDFTLLLDLGKYPTYGKNAPINRGTLRDALSDPIFDAGKVQYEKCFDSYEVINEGMAQECIRVWFHDGSKDDCHLLIGADGSYSKVNAQVGLNSIKPIKQHVALAAKCDLPTERFSRMSKSLFGGPIMTWADGMSFFFGVYLPRTFDKHGNRVTQKEDEEAYDKTLSSCMIGLNVEKQTIPDGLGDASNEEQWNFIADRLSSWSSEHREIVELARGAPLHIYTPRVATKPAKHWRENVRHSSGVIEKGHPRVWLMGDSIHAMLPPRGMGGNQSMYDAAVILPLISEMVQRAKLLGKPISRAHIEVALKKYENEMVPRAFAWVKKSGGNNFVPIDSSTLSGRLFFFIFAQLLNLACIWARLRGVFLKKPFIDTIPEFKWAKSHQE
ncbi:hypothetical protein F4810DRAFT_696167 [Camillea tinctor]|nr:hypothetical protein F4810DRAFT_696167 [Camillea tinctor]